MPITLKSISNRYQLSPTLKANETVAALRKQGRAIYQMGFGQSPFPVPDRLQKTLQGHVARNDYVATAGIHGLQEAALDYYQKQVGLNADDYDVLIAPGSKLLIYILQMAVEGDLLMPVPSWVSYAPQAHLLDIEVIPIPTQRDKDGMQIDPEDLKKRIAEARAKGLNPSKIILNYPNNPTGLTIPDDNLQALAAVCIEENILILSDEIYGFVLFEGQSYQTISTYAPDHTVITTGLSKHMSLGGWRLGVAFIPKALEGLYAQLCYVASELWSCVPVPVQLAAIDAYQGHQDIEDFIQDCSAIHGLMNQYVASSLRAQGIHAPKPQGAFYNYPDFAALRDGLAEKGIHTSADLSEHLTHEYGVVTLPGEAFGAAGTDLTLRLSACDYDGAEALQAYRRGAALDEALIAQYAPNVKTATEALVKFCEG